VYSLVKERSLKSVFTAYKKAPYELIPFVLSMFIIVLALSHNCITDALSGVLVTGGKTDAISFGFLSAVSSNLLNNIPMSVLFEKIISNSLPALYGSVIGSNIGAFITPVGALAGIMWNKILKSYGVKLSFIKFVLYGVTVAIPVLIASTLTLFLIV
jgi:arsenical pump membrane protein